MTHVTENADAVLTTILGSCVAACLFDPQAMVGGMNHFLLAEPRPGTLDADGERFGVHAMELLINEMLKRGAVRSRLRAHLYGGANMHAGMTAIGTGNAEFALRFLSRDRIPLMHSNLGGVNARRVDFRAARGQARCRIVRDVPVSEVAAAPRRPESAGDVELF